MSEETFFRMIDVSPHANSLVETLNRRIVIIDGAMGTMIKPISWRKPTIVARNSRVMGGIYANATTS